MERILNLQFDLRTLAAVKVDGKQINLRGTKLFLEDINDRSMLAQMRDQYNADDDTKDVAVALFTAHRLCGGWVCNDATVRGFLDDMVKFATLVLNCSNIVAPKVRADLEKIVSIGSVEQPTA